METAALKKFDFYNSEQFFIENHENDVMCTFVHNEDDPELKTLDVGASQSSWYKKFVRTKKCSQHPQATLCQPPYKTRPVLPVQVMAELSTTSL